MGATVSTSGGSLVPVGGVLDPQTHVTIRAKQRTNVRGLAMSDATLVPSETTLGRGSQQRQDGRRLHRSPEEWPLGEPSKAGCG